MKTMEKKGFTLIELLIVIAIIGILAVAFLPSLLGAPAKGRDTQRLTSVQKVENFLVTEMLTGESLPATGCINDATDIGILINANIANFGGVFPSDPQTDSTIPATAPLNCANGQYGYIKFATGLSYTAGVYSIIEEPENANVLCSVITAAADFAIDPNGTYAADDACYAALIQ